MTSSTNTDWLSLAGVMDVAEFYRQRFFTGGVLDARYFNPIDRFHMKFARTMWVYDNVRRGSTVLDLGCGEGFLALLKRKDCYLAGVDLSPELVKLARSNGYDSVSVASVKELPFPSHCFDYVVSLDLLGHVGFKEKNATLAEIKRVLRPDGVTMHGIECLNRELHQDYEAMSPETLAQFVNVDGHIGLEVEEEIAARFSSFFSSVQIEPRYSLCLTAAEFIKQYDQYGVPFERDFIDYLRGLSFDESNAFDLAMGYVFGRISDLGIRLPPSGLYSLLKASNANPEPFYNAHRDRSDLFSAGAPEFSNGWYPANRMGPIARWMTNQSRLRFQARELSRIQLQLTTHIPELRRLRMQLEFELNGTLVGALSLFDYGWLEVALDIPIQVSKASQDFTLVIRSNRTWQPSLATPDSNDDRHLSIAVCNLEIK